MLNTTLIDHEAGQDPILGQPHETQDQVDKRYRSMWGQTVLPSDDCLATFIDSQVTSWQALLGHNETDRVFVMKMVDKMFTSNENTMDAIEDYGNTINKKITDYDHTANTGSDIDRNKLDRMQEQHQQLQHQYKFARYKDRNQFNITQTSQIEFQKLQAEYELSYTLFAELERQKAAQEIQVRKDTPIFTTINPAAVPLDPSKPNRFKIVLIYVIMGFFLAVFYGLGIEFYKKIKTAWINN